MIINFAIFKFKKYLSSKGLVHLKAYRDFVLKYRNCVLAEISKSINDDGEYFFFSMWKNKEDLNKLNENLKETGAAQRSFFELINILEKEPEFRLFELIE